MSTIEKMQTIEVPVQGMDCAECTQHVHSAIAKLPGVETVNVLLSSEKAVIRLNPDQVSLASIALAVKSAGYTVPDAVNPIGTASASGDDAQAIDTGSFTRRILGIFGILFGIILFAVVVGEWFGFFDSITRLVPWYVGTAIVLVAGFPIFRNVVQAALRKQVIAHTLMSLGVVAALVIGQWATAVVIVFFMRIGQYTETLTTERARRAVKDLTTLAPQMARVERDGIGGMQEEVAIGSIQVGDVVLVLPGEKIPVDGDVISGQATVNQATITGESMPVEVGSGSSVYAATIAQLGSIRVRTTRVGTDTTFGRVVQLVEEAEAHRAAVQRIADKVSAYYLPVVAGIAALTFILRQDPLATAAVLVVACSCSFAIATPIAMLASVGAAAKRGLLIKGGKYIEELAQVDVLLLDKTGTLTLGQPRITDVVTLNGLGENELLALVASAELYSEHPLANAVRTLAAERNIPHIVPQDFKTVPGAGVQAQVNGDVVAVGNYRLVQGIGDSSQAMQLQAQGKTLLFVTHKGLPAGIVAAADALRPEVPAALRALREGGIRQIELLTGDNEATASALARELGIGYRAGLLPEDKIAIVREYQAKGHKVAMIGDGVNDAPALAQANVGIAMGAGGTDIAVEAGHVVLMRQNWALIPDLFRIAHRTMRVVKGNLAFTIVYNIIGLTLAACGFLPPIFAAAAQSIPDLGILANSARLLRQK